MVYPRSGSTLLTQILTSHDEVLAFPECSFLLYLHQSHKNFKYSTNDIESFARELIKTKKFEYWNLTYTEIVEYLIKNRPKNYNQAAYLIYKLYAQKNKPSAKYFVDKNNWYSSQFEVLNGIYPQAKFIHLIRDGRDVAASLKSLKNKTEYKNNVYFPETNNTIKELAYKWRFINSQLIDASNAYPQKFIVIRYEDLIYLSNEIMKSLSEFLSLTYVVNIDNFNVKSKQLLPKEFYSNYSPELRRDRIDVYLNSLKVFEIDEFNDISNVILDKYGYHI
jgi:hypothetical protein